MIRLTLLFVAVVSVEPIWKMKTDPGSSWPSRVSVPVSWAEEALVYTPATKVGPPRSAAMAPSDARPAASLYAIVRSDCA